MCYVCGMPYELPPAPNPNIDVPRLFADLEITEADLALLAALHIPRDIRVPSLSAIKTGTVADTLALTHPGADFEVLGVKAPSGVAEQPLGQVALDGASNRLANGIDLREQAAPGEIDQVAWFSIENGLFRVGNPAVSPAPESREKHGEVRDVAGANLSADFDPDAAYEDRAVVAIRLPGRPTVVQVSPASEAVLFPRAAVQAAHDAPGGFAQHTAGSKLAELGLVQDKQNPHSELTANRQGGPLPREDQMARVIVRGLLRLARQTT